MLFLFIGVKMVFFETGAMAPNLTANMTSMFEDQMLNILPVMFAGLAGIIVGLIFVFLLIALGVYIYSSLAFMSIAKKKKLKSPGIAWIPLVGKPLIAAKIAGMHWWPVLLLIAIIIPGVGSLAVLAFVVFFFIWMWKTFEAFKKPGWWILLKLIPLVGSVLYWIFIGIIAWEKK
jgi:hypothetical protein